MERFFLQEPQSPYTLITDVDGLDRSYHSDNNVYVHNKTLFISGTHSFGDVLTDATIPFHLLSRTPRYKQAERVLLENPTIDTIVSHSLGSAIAQVLADNPRVKTVRAYASPTIFSNPKVIHLRHPHDFISMSNLFGRSDEITAYDPNVDPHSYRGHRDYFN